MACNALANALKNQAQPSTHPSINVVAAIVRVMAFDPGWTKELGRAAAQAIRDEVERG